MIQNSTIARRSPLRLFIPDNSDDGGQESQHTSATRIWREFTEPGSEVAHIRADYLACAHRVTQSMRHATQSETAEKTAVILQIEVAIDRDPATARRTLRRERPSVGTDCPTFRFVGSQAGLIGLIADIYVSETADGVALVPLLSANRPDEICEEVVSELRTSGLLAVSPAAEQEH